MATTDKPVDDGFEIVLAKAEKPGEPDNREFFPWHLSDVGKDLQLIDRFTAMPVQEFFELIEDNFDRGRAPILLAMMATSVRAKHPDWTVERIVRLIQGVSLGDVHFIDAETEEQQVPPAGGGETPPTTSEPSADASSSSSTLPASSPSETSSAIPA